MTYSLLPGLNASQFLVVGRELRVGPTALDFEVGATRQVNVRATDPAGLYTDVTLVVNVTNVNEIPRFTSGNAYHVNENTTAIATVTATDPEQVPLVFAIVGGSDKLKFSINVTSGVLTFVASQNFEAPTDVNGDNVYLVTVSASDGVTPAVTRSIAVTVHNVNEAPTLDDQSFLALAENSANGLPVGTVAAADVDAGQSLVYAITAGNTNGT